MLDPLDFEDLSPQEVPVKNLFGKNYVLKEITAAVAVAVDNARFGSARLDEKGNIVGLPRFASSVPVTVGMSMYEVTFKGDNGAYEYSYWKDEDGKKVPVPVGEGFVLALPCGVQKKLYQRLLDISPDFEPKADRTELLKQREKIDKALKDFDAPKGEPVVTAGTTP